MNNRLKIIKKKCKTCKKEFNPKWKHIKYCSPECRDKERAEQVRRSDQRKRDIKKRDINGM